MVKRKKIKHKKSKQDVYYFPERKMKAEVVATSWNSTIHSGHNPFVAQRDYQMYHPSNMLMPRNVYLSNLERGASVHPFRGDGRMFVHNKNHKSKKYGLSLFSKSKYKGKKNKWWKGDGYKQISIEGYKQAQALAELKKAQLKVMKLSGSIQIPTEPRGEIERAKYYAEQSSKRLGTAVENYQNVLEPNKKLKEQLKGLSAEQLINAPEAAPESSYKEKEYARLKVNKLKRETEKKIAREDKLLKRAQSYDRIRETPTYQALDYAQERAKEFKQHALTKGAKKLLTQKYSASAQRTAGRVKSATFGLISALTETGGIGDGRSLIPLGTKGGLSGYTKNPKGAGRPKGTYKYGLPIKELMKAQREQKRQLEVQKLIAEQTAMEAEARRQIQQSRLPQQQMSRMPPQQMQMQQMQIPEETLSDNDLMRTFGEATQGSFITPELIQDQQQQIPIQQMPASPSEGMSVTEQAAASFNSRTSPKAVPGLLLPNESKIGQPQRSNPFRLRARWRPNFGMNIFKTVTTQPLKFQNAILRPARVASTQPILRPANTNPLISPNSIIVPSPTIRTNTLSTTSMDGMRPRRIIPNDNPSVRNQNFQFKNRDESGMLA